MPTRPRWKRFAFRLTAAAISLCLSLVAGELALRTFRPGYAPLFLDIYCRDARGLIGLRPGVTRRHVTDEWDVTVSINGDGLRGAERKATGRSARPGSWNVRRVLGVGDSLTFGWGVEESEAFLSIAQSAPGTPSLRTVNAGFPGSGPLDQLRWLRHHGDRQAPDLVVLSFFVGNDFVDVRLGGLDGQFDVRNGLLVRQSAHGGSGPSWERRLREFVKRNSLLAQHAARMYWAFGRDARQARELEHTGLNRRDYWLREFFQIHLDHPPERTGQAIKKTLQTLDAIRGWCGRRRLPLLLMIIPRSFQVYEWEIARWTDAFPEYRRRLDLDRPQRQLVDWAERHDVAVLDLLPHFRDAARRPDHERLYFYPNAHMSAAGHRLTGRLLARRLRELERRGESTGTRQPPAMADSAGASPVRGQSPTPASGTRE